MTPRRQLTVVALCCLADGALVVAAAGRTWARASAVAEPIQVPVVLTGGELAPALPALGLVALAGSLALPAAVGWSRRVVAALLAAVGVAVVWFAVTGMAGADRELAREAASALAGSTVASPSLLFWPWPAIVGGALLALGGAAAALLSSRWPGMSGRYDRAGADPPTADPAGDVQLDMWRALDRGDDPTDRG